MASKLIIRFAANSTVLMNSFNSTFFFFLIITSTLKETLFCLALTSDSEFEWFTCYFWLLWVFLRGFFFLLRLKKKENEIGIKGNWNKKLFG